MPNSNILPGTSIAATTLIDEYACVFTQDIDGRLRKAFSMGSGWSSSTLGDDIPQAKLNTPLAALYTPYNTTCYVYYLNPANEIIEIYQAQEIESPCKQGPLNALSVTASPASRLAVCRAPNDDSIFLYYQRPDGAIGELRRDKDKWVQGRPISDKALIGTGLAALAFKSDYYDNGQAVGTRVFYQNSRGHLVQIGDPDFPDGFIPGNLDIATAAATTNLAAVWMTVPDKSTSSKLKLYFFNQLSIPSKWGYSSMAWHDENYVYEATAFPDGGIAIVPEIYQANKFKLFIQDKDNQIQEFTWTEGDSDWKRASIIPTANVQ